HIRAAARPQMSRPPGPTADVQNAYVSGRDGGHLGEHGVQRTAARDLLTDVIDDRVRRDPVYKPGQQAGTNSQHARVGLAWRRAVRGCRAARTNPLLQTWKLAGDVATELIFVDLAPHHLS